MRQDLRHHLCVDLRYERRHPLCVDLREDLSRGNHHDLKHEKLGLKPGSHDETVLLKNAERD